jgi:ribonuclease-3
MPSDSAVTTHPWYSKPLNSKGGLLARFRAAQRKRSLEPRARRVVAHLEDIFGTWISNPNLYAMALRHRSKLVESQYKDHESYEQLEFLGDAVLDLIVAELIYNRYPTKDEGFMTQMRSRIVRAEALAQLADTLRLAEVIEIGDRVRDQGIETSVNVMSDIFEALIGALYRDRGFSVVFAFVERVILSEIDFSHIEQERDNFKSLLLEYAQSRKLGTPTYRISDVEGPDHERTYTIQVLIGTEVRGMGTGKSKKKAEQKAAEEALASFGVTIQGP